MSKRLVSFSLTHHWTDWKRQRPSPHSNGSQPSGSIPGNSEKTVVCQELAGLGPRRRGVPGG